MNMWTYTILKFNPYGMIFLFTIFQLDIGTDRQEALDSSQGKKAFKKTFKKAIALIFSLFRSYLLNLANIEINSFQYKSGQVNIKRMLGDLLVMLGDITRTP